MEKENTYLGKLATLKLEKKALKLLLLLEGKARAAIIEMHLL